MNRASVVDRRISAVPRNAVYGLVCVIALSSLCAVSKSQTQSDAQRLDTGSVHVTHVLGFEDARHSVTGDLKIQGATLQFQRDEILTAQVTLGSIEDVFIEDAERQVGGTAMTLGKAAVPYGGGRVVSLFAHKKYDIVTVEYRDDKSGFHGAIFQFGKGQGQAFKTNLLASGAHSSSSEDRGARQSPTEVKHESKFTSTALSESRNVGPRAGGQRWSLQINRVDPGDVGLEPSFRTAIYENLLEELAKTNQFKQLFRSGDRNANDVSSILTLKTIVQKYTPGSETRRAVTTLGGATKLSVRIQLVARDGHVVLDNTVDGNVRFVGGNLRATHNLAHHVAQTLKQAALPKQSDAASQTETGKTSN